MAQLTIQLGNNLSHATTINENDFSGGLEPVSISATQVSTQDIKSLSRFEQYIIDSLLPDGTSIAETAPPDSVANPVEDDDSGDEEIEGGCGCHPGPEGVRTCTRTDGASCECVGDYGNFYANPEDRKAGGQTLNLDALPDKWPLVECSADCSCSKSCSNRLTQSGVRHPLSVLPVAQAGLGLFYTPSESAILSRGSFISLYAGEYLTTPQARLRWSTHNAQAGGGNYILSLRLPDLTVHIDPRRIGNIGRFLNHSCDPNCIIQVVRWGVGTWPRAAIFTKREILAGEELTFDYGNASGSSDHDLLESEGGVDGQNGQTRTRCYCGSMKCRGWMPFDETL